MGLTKKDFNAALPKETAEVFEVINLQNRNSLVVNFHKHGTVDFQTLSLKKAEHLEKQGAEFIQRKPLKKCKESDEPVGNQ